MKKFSCFFVVFLLFALICGGLFAEDSPAGAADDFFGGDLDSLFDDPPEESPGEVPPPAAENPPQNNNGLSVLDTIRKKTGITLDAGFNSAAGYSPGWDTAPWYWDESDETFDQLLLAKMESTLALDIQFSDILRVKQSYSLAIPGLALTVSEFFFDYNVFDVVFLRAGKYTLNWGISPNFSYANLPARIPNNSKLGVSGDLYIMRADIPIGIGGFQAAAMTRSSIFGSGGHIDSPEKGEDRASISDKIFFGTKFNLAVPFIDIDVGFLYNKRHDTRAFLALKTTLFDQLELYAEGVISYNFNTHNNFAGSGSIGVMQEFFDRQLSVNAELFYNGEEGATHTPSASFFGKDDSIPLIGGFNTALNVRYKPSWLKKTEFFLNYLHGFDENTAQLVPGFRITPFSNFNIYAALPMALGSKTGQYYKSNVDEKNRPFSIVLMFTFSGSYRYSNM